jgi:hypothetical protein
MAPRSLQMGLQLSPQPTTVASCMTRRTHGRAVDSPTDLGVTTTRPALLGTAYVAIDAGNRRDRPRAEGKDLSFPLHIIIGVWRWRVLSGAGVEAAVVSTRRGRVRRCTAGWRSEVGCCRAGGAARVGSSTSKHGGLPGAIARLPPRSLSPWTGFL